MNSTEMVARFVRALALFTAVCTPGFAQGSIMNGGFESGDFGGWTLANYGASDAFAAIVDSRAGGPMIEGQHSALLVAAGGMGAPWICPSDPWTVTCKPFPPIPFTNTPPTGPKLSNQLPGSQELATAGIVWLRFGSILGQDFSAMAGDHIQLNWRWLSNDVAYPTTGTDDAVFLITNGKTVVGFNGRKLVGPSCGLGQTITGFRSGAGGCTFDVAVPTDGTWTLYAAIGQGEDVYVSSAILVDSVAVYRISEPEGFSLAALLLAALASRGRSRRALWPTSEGASATSR